jgi:hypothetical protein
MAIGRVRQCRSQMGCLEINQNPIAQSNS